jgi:hypothetical protein
MNIFKINDETFEIAQAYIDALLDDEEDESLVFGLIIECKEVDDNTLPCIETETILKIKKNEIKKWQDIAERVVEWKKCSKNTEKPYAKFINHYKKSFRSNFIYNAKIEFLNIDNKMFVKLKGLCDSKFNGKEIKTLSLDIETEIQFSGINVGHDETEEAARSRLQPYLDTQNFKYSVSKLELSNGSVDVGKFVIK